MADYRTVHPSSQAAGRATAQIDAGLRAHMNKVYGTMSVGLLITGLAAWALSNLAVSATPTGAMIAEGKYLTSLGQALYLSPLKWVVMFAPLAMVFAFGAAVNRLSAAGAQTFFYAYAALMGVSLSSIFLVFTGVSITQTFLVTSIAFASLSLYGYTTKRDLGPIGAFLMMGLIGIIVASIVNIFLGSSALHLGISVIGVLIFAGLTAYDTQKIKNDYIAHAHAMDSEWLAKSAIMGALNLYLDFINLFMFLLQFLGNRE
ncbi:Bax inhibitor-1 family protein [Celeribacter sp.]|uniref:Bax inhibitor-1/YccA family protein n=1 Tax=Celeribacter sp. TaxID=1890673 RepID=UPI003A95D69F